MVFALTETLLPHRISERKVIRELHPLDNKIVVWGMSCVGKTTFAGELDHHYYCFDALFHWRLIESLGLPVEENLRQLSKNCTEERYVLDGWTLADIKGECLPEGARVYVVYASYEQIISQYRIPVHDPEEYRQMYWRWYDINYETLGARYFRSEGSQSFVETGVEDFYTLVRTKSKNCNDI